MRDCSYMVKRTQCHDERKARNTCKYFLSFFVCGKSFFREYSRPVFSNVDGNILNYALKLSCFETSSHVIIEVYDILCWIWIFFNSLTSYAFKFILFCDDIIKTTKTLPSYAEDGIIYRQFELIPSRRNLVQSCVPLPCQEPLTEGSYTLFKK